MHSDAKQRASLSGQIPGLIPGLILAGLVVMIALVIQSKAVVSRDPVAYIVYTHDLIMGTALPPGTLARILDPFILSNYLLYFPATLLTLAGIGVEPAHKLVCFALFAWSFWHLIRFTAPLPGRGRWALLPTYAFVGLILPVDGFGQKEHLYLLMILPYVLNAMTPQARATPATVIATAFALVIKPYLIGPWVMIEAYRGWRDGWRSLINPTNAAVVAVHLLYYGVVALLVSRLPDSPQEILAVFDLKRSYMRVDLETLIIRRFTLIWLVAVIVLPMFLAVATLRRGTVVWLLVLAGAVASVIVQGAGLDYHWHLVAAVAGLALAWIVANVSGRRLVATTAALLLYFGLASVRTYTFTLAECRGGVYLGELAQAIAGYGKGKSLALFSTDYAPLNQLLAVTGMPNGLSFESLWFMDVIATRPDHPDARALMARTAAEVAADLARPGVLVLLPESANAGLTLLLQQPDIKTALSRYRQAGTVFGYQVLAAD